MLPLPISSIEYSSSLGLRVMSFGGICSPPSLSGNYILNWLALAPLVLGLMFLSRIALSLIFKVIRRAHSLTYSRISPLSAISLALSSGYVSLRVRHFFLQRGYSFFAFFFWWVMVSRYKGSHHLLTVMFARFVTVFSLIFISLYFLWIRIVASWRQS